MARVASEVEHSLKAAGVTAIEARVEISRIIRACPPHEHMLVFRRKQYVLCLGSAHAWHQDKLQDGVPEAITSIKDWNSVLLS